MRRANVVALAALGALGSLVAVVGFGALAACGRETIPVASIDDAGADGALRECTAKSPPCDDQHFCSYPTCDTTGVGKCLPIPDAASCPEQALVPVCGCDGVTYFNDCLRQAEQKSLSANGQCDPLKACDAGPACATMLFTGCNTSGCPNGQSCALVFSLPLLLFSSSFCSDALVGITPFLPRLCWALPEACPASGSPTVLQCGDEDAGWLNECAAIREGGVFWEFTN